MDETVQCLNCVNFQFQDDMKRRVTFSNIGCGNCRHDKPFTYYGAEKERICKKFEVAPEATINKRKLFINAIEENGK